MISFILSIFYLLMYIHGNDVMTFFDLQWQSWVLKIFFVGFLIFKYIFIGKMCIKLFKWYHSKYIQKPSILKKIIILLLPAFIVVISLVMIGWEAFIISMMPKEYIVIRNEKKCIASVVGWHDSSVEYFERKGLFFMEEKSFARETYLRTNDPFKAGTAPFEK